MKSNRSAAARTAAQSLGWDIEPTDQINAVGIVLGRRYVKLNKRADARAARSATDPLTPAGVLPLRPRRPLEEHA